MDGLFLLPCRGRIYAARSCMADCFLRESCGPGMPGPYRAAICLFTTLSHL